MDLYSLDSNFLFDKPIRGYDSLIWTERYRDPGDFSLKTAKIDEVMDAAPVGSCLGIIQSREIMFVETHEINKNKDGMHYLTVSGRTFESFMEYRTNAIELGAISDGLTVMQSSDESGSSTSGPGWATTIVTNVLEGLADPKDAIPNVFVSFEVTKPLTGKIRYETLSNNLYVRMMELLDEDGIGVKNRRPIPPETYMSMVFYNGQSRSNTVILDSRLGHFEVANYLNSIKGSYTAAYGRTDKAVAQKYASSTVTANTGLARRVAYVDSLDIKDTTISKELVRMGTRMTAFFTESGSKGMILDCNVSPTIPFVYGQDYFLGDTVRCIGDYGINQPMIVTEYIRSQEGGRDLGYPSLVAPVGKLAVQSGGPVISIA